MEGGSSFISSPPDDPAFWAELVDAQINKSIVLKMARAVDPKVMTDALEEAFKPRLALPGRSLAWAHHKSRFHA